MPQPLLDGIEAYANLRSPDHSHRSASASSSPPPSTDSSNRSPTHVIHGQTPTPASTPPPRSPPSNLALLNINDATTAEGRQTISLINDAIIAQDRLARQLGHPPSSNEDSYETSPPHPRRYSIPNLLNQRPPNTTNNVDYNNGNSPQTTVSAPAAVPSHFGPRSLTTINDDENDNITSPQTTVSAPAALSNQRRRTHSSAFGLETTSYGVLAPLSIKRKLCSVYAVEVQVGDVLKWGNEINDGCRVTSVGPEEGYEDEGYVEGGAVKLNATVRIEWGDDSEGAGGDGERRRWQLFEGLELLEVLRVVRRSGWREETEDEWDQECEDGCGSEYEETI